MATGGAAAVREILNAAIADRIFPAAVAEVGDRGRVLWRDALGTMTFAREAARIEPATVFDLASLTKPLVTTSLAMRRPEGTW